jgi:hypothetical protein
VIRKSRLGSSQLTSQKQPRFSGDNKPLAIPVVALGLRQFFFGLRSTLGRCIHWQPPDTDRESAFLPNGQGASLVKTEHQSKILQKQNKSRMGAAKEFPLPGYFVTCSVYA